MKNLFKYSVLALAAVTMASCNDFLEDNRYPDDTQTSNPTYWSSTANVTNQTNAFYNDYVGYASGGSTGGWFYFKTLSDDQAGNSFTDWTYSSVPAAASTWNDPFVEIRRANTIITNVKTSELPEAEKANFIGIARLNRAWQYYQLVRMYGDVQWIEDVIDPDNEAEMYGKRTDRDIVMDNVLLDLDDAIAHIATQANKTKWSRDLALAMKADICLFEGTFCKRRTVDENYKAADPERAEKYLKLAAEAAGLLINSGRYSLNASYQGNYNTMSSMDGNPEMIFYKKYAKDVFGHSVVDYTCSSTQISGMTKDAFDAYLFADGKPLSLTSCDKSDKAEVVGNELKLNKLFKVRDGRLAQTIDSCLCFQGHSWSRAGAHEMTSSTGYSVAKYDNINMPLAYRPEGGKNFTCAPLFWLSKVYLVFAEAKAELGNLTQADLDATINKLVARAGNTYKMTVAPGHDEANNTGVSDIIWEMRRQRRMELMFDDWARYWDLIRWHQLDKLDSNKNPNILLGANIEGLDAYTADVAKKGNYIDGSKGKVRVYAAKHYYYPIPSGQITLNPNLEQNALWK